MVGKGSKRRPCQIGRVEEGLRYGLAFGNITQREFNIGMRAVKMGSVTSKDTETKTGHVCNKCVDGLMVGKATFQPNYEIECRLDSTIHHQWDTCENFREDL